MADQGHLDATAGREVVFCHACGHEWHRDEHGIVCPHCDGDITEIIDPENDPREIDNAHHDGHTPMSSSPGPRFAHDRYDDSDPEEADITEHLHPDYYDFGPPPRQDRDHPHTDPNVDPVITRFIDMVNGFNPSAAGTTAFHHHHRHDPHAHHTDPTHDHEDRGNPHHDADTHDHGDEDERHDHGPDLDHPNIHASPFSRNPFFSTQNVHRTTFRGGPFGGTASITIFSGPVRPRDGPPAEGGPPADPFSEIFTNVLRDMGPPPPAGEGQAPGGGPGQPQGFVRSLQDLLGLLNPANAVAGDAVYSQEALDRIISNLMEVNPQSNAAPPASEDALSKMVRKPVDAEMLGTDDKTECSICIDEMKIGDTAMFLPCKHWFHEDCVILWLKEHNTCPICRTPIEKNDRPGPTSSGNSNNGSGSGDAQQQQQQQGQGQGQGEQPQPGAPQSGARDGAPPPSVPGGWSNFMLGGDGSGTSSPGPSIWFTTRRFEIPTPGSMSASDGSSSASYRQSARPPSQRHSRLNEALRSVSSMQERNRERERERMTGGGNLGLSTGVNPFPDFDTWRLQRRNSLSPTSRRTPTSATRDGDGGTPRVRERSPSQSSGRWAESDRRQAEADQERSGRTRAQNPLSWLRGRLGGGSSGGGSGRSHEGGSGSGGSGSGDDPRS